eukprot:UC1_evm3s2123
MALDQGAAYTARGGGPCGTVSSSSVDACPKDSCRFYEEDAQCRQPFFASTCTGNRYFLLLPVDDTRVLACSAVAQCQLMDARTLEPERPESPPGAGYFRGWYCDHNKPFSLPADELRAKTRANCPVWRYGNGESAAGVIAPDLSKSSSSSSGGGGATSPDTPPQVLYLMSAAEGTRDGAFVGESLFGAGSGRVQRLTKRTLVGGSLDIACRQASDDCSLGTYVKFANEPDRYIVEPATETVENVYTAAWSQGPYVYFLLHDGAPTPRPRVARFCAGSYNGQPKNGETGTDNSVVAFNAFTKVPIDCGSPGNTISGAVFAQPGSTLSSATSGLGANGGYLFAVGRGDTFAGRAAALCVFTLSDPQQPMLSQSKSSINLQTAINIKRGGEGTGDECSVVRDPMSEEAATEATAGYNLAFSSSFNEEYTALTIDVVNGHTVVYVGTQQGSVVQMWLRGVHAPRPAVGFGSVRTFGNTSASTVLSDDGNSGGAIFALASQNIARAPFANCSAATHSGCDACAAAGPYCGWCVLSNSCTERAKCPAVVASADTISRADAYAGPYWLQSAEATNCPRIVAAPSLSPVHVGQAFELPVRVKGVPNPPDTSSTDAGSARYHCLLRDSEGVLRASAEATLVVDGVTATLECSPKVTRLANPALHSESLDFDLAYGVAPEEATGLTLTGPVVRVTVYSCSALPSCHECGDSAYGCGWCALESKCVATATSCRTSADFIIDNNLCPRVLELGPARMVPAGTSDGRSDTADRRLYLKAANLPVPASGYAYKCKATPVDDLASGGVTEATRVNATHIECYAPVLLTDATAEGGGFVSRTVNLLLGDSVVPPADNAAKTSLSALEYYDCAIIAGGPLPLDGDCSQCLADVTSRFPCGWCTHGSADTHRCTVQSMCDSPSLFKASGAADAGSACPNPSITSFSPASVPLEGGTPVVIIGQNLGRGLADIEDVRLAGSSCSDVTYDVSARTIVCTSNRVSSPRFGPVEVHVRSQTPAESATNIDLVQPTVTGSNRTAVNAAGGVIMRLMGSYLDSGAAADLVVQRDGGSGGSVGGTNNEVLMRCASTLLRADKQVSCVLAGIAKGTSAVTAPISARACLQIDAQRDTVDCVSDPVSLRVLPNPVVNSISPATTPAAGGVIARVNGTYFEGAHAVTFQARSPGGGIIATGACSINSVSTLDCPLPVVAASTVAAAEGSALAVSLRFFLDNAQSSLTVGALTYYPDPVLTRITPQAGAAGDLVSVEGNWLKSGGVPTVLIGGVPAAVVSSQDSSLTVSVPDLGLPSTTAVEFSLRLGAFAVTYPEPFSAEVAGPSESSTDFPTVIVGASVGAAFGVLLLVFVIAYRYQVRKKRADNARLFKQMQDLESQVAAVCKQGFAELQRDEALTLSEHTLEPRAFADFARRVYFTRPDTHPAPIEVRTPQLGDVISGFDALLHNEEFVLGMVHAMEGTGKAFSVEDRCHVAALLACALLPEHPNYVWGLLQALLEALMRRGVARKQQTKLFFRRTESVAEKFLTCWLTAGLYNHVRLSGREFYRLVEALHLQSLKGPIDAATGAAMYTLNADTLLRTRVEFESLALTVVLADGGEVRITVTSCSTVSQVKRLALETALRTTTTMASPAQNDGPIPRMEAWDLVEAGWPGEGRRLLSDVDESSQQEPASNSGSKKGVGMVRLNTLAHYGIVSGAQLQLVKGRFSRSRLPAVDAERWHLVKPADFREGQSKVPSEIYLAYLMTVKGTVQPFVDDIFEAMFDNKAVPPTVKALFDFLDMKAVELGVADLDVVHVWKNNCLPLRFWANVLKNPEFVFEFHKSDTVNSCLSTLGQVLMDSCSLSTQRLSKHSPANKHLYRRDVEGYRKRVRGMYSTVRNMRSLKDGVLEAEFVRKGDEAPVADAAGSKEALLGYCARHRTAICALLTRKGHGVMADQFNQLTAQFDDAVLFERRRKQREAEKTAAAAAAKGAASGSGSGGGGGGGGGGRRRTTRFGFTLPSSPRDSEGYLDVMAAGDRTSVAIDESLFEAVMASSPATAGSRNSGEFGFGSLLRGSFKRGSKGKGSRKKRNSGADYGFGEGIELEEAATATAAVAAAAASPPRSFARNDSDGYLVPETPSSGIGDAMMADDSAYAVPTGGGADFAASPIGGGGGGGGGGADEAGAAIGEGAYDLPTPPHGFGSTSEPPTPPMRASAYDLPTPPAVNVSGGGDMGHSDMPSMLGNDAEYEVPDVLEV